jgi:hypothetical protein
VSISLVFGRRGKYTLTTFKSIERLFIFYKVQIKLLKIETIARLRKNFAPSHLRDLDLIISCAIWESIIVTPGIQPKLPSLSWGTNTFTTRLNHKFRYEVITNGLLFFTYNLLRNNSAASNGYSQHMFLFIAFLGAQLLCKFQIWYLFMW